MAQPWAMRERLVDGQGNFGSVEGDPPAAMRYTEARLTHLGAALMEDMEKDTVNFVANYDETTTEPTVFPAAFPNLLVNGGTGIAVGMATNIPPHNLGEVIDAVCAQVDNPDITTEEILTHIKGPDFPTGCNLLGLAGIRPVRRDRARQPQGPRQDHHRGDPRAAASRSSSPEIPYAVNRAVLVERIAELVNTKVITDITAVRDESDENTRVVIELKREAIPQIVVNNLYQHTALETTFSVNMLAIDHGRPKLLSIKDALGGVHRAPPRGHPAPHALRAARRRGTRRGARRLSSSRWRTWMISSASSANRPTATRRASSCSPSSGASAQIAGFGIEVRDAATGSRTAATRSANGRPTPSSTCASTNSPGWSATRSPPNTPS